MSRSIAAGISGLKIEAPDVKGALAFYGEGSGPNKRPNIEEPPIPQAPISYNPTSAPHIPSEEEKPERKGRKRVGKKPDPQPLIGMFNDELGKYEKPISVRKILQACNVDISLLDLAS